MRPGPAALALLCAVLAVPAPAADVDDLLAAPPDAVHLALLLPHAGDARVPPRWREALASTDPRARALGARALHVAAVRADLPSLVAALEKEEEPLVARELIGSLAALAGGEATPAVLAAARRLGGEVAIEAAVRMGERGDIRVLQELGDLPDSARQWASDAALRANPALLERLAPEAIRSVPAWAAVLAAAEKTGHPLDPTLLARALYPPDTREPTLWYLLTSAQGAPAPPAVVAAVDATTTAGPSAAAELVLRRQGRPPRLDLRPSLGPKVIPALLRAREWDVLPLLSEEERREMARTLHAGDAKYYANSTRVRGEDLPLLRAVAGLPAGVVAGVLKDTGCTVRGRPSLARAVVRFGPQGGPVDVEPAAGTTGGCARAMRVLGGLMLDDGATRDLSQEFYVSDDPEVAECANSSGGLRAPLRAGGSVPPPRLIHSEPLHYPEDAERMRLSGYLRIDAVLSPGGCVQRAQVIHAPHAILEAEALRGLLHWRYAPTLVDGVPVAVSMTIAADFAMK